MGDIVTACRAFSLRKLRLCGGILVFLVFARASEAQQSPAQPEKPAAGSPANPPAAEPPPFNPVPAEKDVDVATFYIKKGDPDAAISRLEEAIQLKPDYAKPRLLLGQIYEKKKENDNAVKYYREYLQVFPHAPDAKKIQARIDKLSSH
jgi:Tfp pilus assembly protein PilF